MEFDDRLRVTNLVKRLSTPATQCKILVWHCRGNFQIFLKMLLKAVSKERIFLQSNLHRTLRTQPYRERQCVTIFISPVYTRPLIRVGIRIKLIRVRVNGLFRVD